MQEVPNVVVEMSASHVDRPIKMMVYNSRCDAMREVTIIPSHAWGGKTLLGASIRFSRYDGANERVWRVLDVADGSPAHLSGLIPLDDWIVGSPDAAIYTEDDFYNLIVHNLKKPVRMAVWNRRRDATREVEVTPSFEWGGQGWYKEECV